MLKYPFYVPQLNVWSRLTHVTKSFGGFTDLLVHDGERRRKREQEAKEGRMSIVYRVYFELDDGGNVSFC